MTSVSFKGGSPKPTAAPQGNKKAASNFLSSLLGSPKASNKAGGDAPKHADSFVKHSSKK